MSKLEGTERYFKLHIHPSVPQVNNISHFSNKKKEKEEATDQKEQKTITSILKDAWKQLVASFIILVIGFFALNFSAYYQIAKNKLEKLTGTEEESPLHQLVEEPNVKSGEQVLTTSSNPEIQKKQIPALNLEIAPSDNRIIIPRIDQNIPIVRISSENLIRRDWGALEKEMQEALGNGVVHYPGTSLPGENGNIAITGHSSYFPWDPGRFKDVFALLHDVVEGDKIVIYYEQDKYIYEVYDIEVVLPEDIGILKQTPEDKLTLITCTPVGTNLKRLIVSAKPIEVNGKKIENKILR